MKVWAPRTILKICYRLFLEYFDIEKKAGIVRVKRSKKVADPKKKEDSRKCEL